MFRGPTPGPPSSKRLLSQLQLSNMLINPVVTAQFSSCHISGM